MSHLSRACRTLTLFGLGLALTGVSVLAQTRLGVPAVPPPDRPVVLHTSDVARIRVVPVVTGLDHPWGMAFRQNGDILVTERDKGTLRLIRNGQLLERPVPGVPEVYAETQRAGLMDIAVHPDDDSLVYLTYSKAVERDGERGATGASGRGRPDGGSRHLCGRWFGPRRGGVANHFCRRWDAVHDRWWCLPVCLHRGVCPGSDDALWEVAASE